MLLALLMLLAAVGPSSPAAGQQSGEEPLSLLARRDVTCPICRKPFVAMACPRSNARGGVDRDLFARAVGPQPEFYRIWTCPRCAFSGYAADFDAGLDLPPALRIELSEHADRRSRSGPAPPDADAPTEVPTTTAPARLTGLAMPEGFGPRSDPAELDPADRYRLAIECYQRRNQSDESLAWLHLRASWVAREEGAILPPEPRLARVFQFAERWRPVLAPGDNQADAELRTATFMVEAIASGRFNRFQRPYVELAAALILRRHGENITAEAMLDRAEAAGAFEATLGQGIARMRDSIQRERDHQRRAAECFERALLAEQIGGGNRPTACYLLAELNRRLGREREARAWYDRAAADALLPDPLRVWVAEQRAARLRGSPDGT